MASVRVVYTIYFARGQRLAAAVSMNVDSTHSGRFASVSHDASEHRIIIQNKQKRLKRAPLATKAMAALARAVRSLSQSARLDDPLRTMLNPAWASSLAQPRPIFRPDPVISAVRFFNAIRFFLLCLTTSFWDHRGDCKSPKRQESVTIRDSTT